MKIIELKIILYVIILILFEGCSRRLYVMIPDEKIIIECPFSNPIGCIPIDAKDTAMVNKRAFIGVFEIKDIKVQKGVYKIEVKCDSLYKDGTEHWCEIYSIKDKHIKGFKKIKKGYKYEMVLNPYFFYDYLSDFAFREVNLNGRILGISTGAINIYTSPNLKGLYYSGGNVSN